MSDEELEWLNAMQKNSYTIEDIIKYFMKNAKGRKVSELEIEMWELIEQGNSSEEEILAILKSKLGPRSCKELEELLKSGMPKSEIIKLMLKNGKTAEMEEAERKSIINNFVCDDTLSLEEKVSRVKSQLNLEAMCLMEELLRQGYAKDEVMDLFSRCANDLNLATSDAMFKKTVRFSDEPPDSYLYEARNVWTMMDMAEVRLNVPMMNNNSKRATFATFFHRVVKLTTGRGLTHREIMDLIRFRLGGEYAAEFDELRSQGYRLQELVDHFLMKDEIHRQESIRRARLRARSKIDAEVRLRRSAYKDKWGIALDYSYRYQHTITIAFVVPPRPSLSVATTSCCSKLFSANRRKSMEVDCMYSAI